MLVMEAMVRRERRGKEGGAQAVGGEERGELGGRKRTLITNVTDRVMQPHIRAQASLHMKL